MKEMLLCAAPPREEPNRDYVLWSGRAERPGIVCIEEMLGQKLIKIRSEHMQWAWKTGNTPTKSGTLAQRLECGSSPSMWWISLIYERHPKLSPYLHDIYKLRCVELLLLSQKPEALCFCGQDRLLARALAKLCAAYGIRFRQISEPQPAIEKPDLMRRVYNALPAPMAALLRLGHWLLTVKRKLPYSPDLAQASPDGRMAATMVAYFPNIDLHAAGEGRFRSRYWESLHDAINQEARAENPDGPHFVRWLFIRFPSPDLSLARCISLRDLFQKKGEDGLSFKFLEEYLSGRDICSALRRWLRIAIQSVQLEKVFRQNCNTEDSRLDFWPFVQKQWAESMRGWRCLERCLFAAAFRNYAQAAGRQRWNLFPLENCPWERMFTEACRSVPQNGKVIGGQHSAIRPTDFRYFDSPQTFSDPACAAFQPDIIAGNGASACDQWQSNGMPKERMRQVEALRYLYLAKAGRHAANQEDLPPEPGEPVRKLFGKKLLILTSFFQDETEAHLNLVSRAFAQGVLQDWAITLKPHPCLLPDRWLAGLAPEYRKQIFVAHGSLESELKPGVAVWASNSTTASVEAAIRGLALMVMAPHNDFDLCPIQNAPGLLRTATVNDVRNGLACARPMDLPHDYLNLNQDLSAWRDLLGLTAGSGTGKERR